MARLYFSAVIVLFVYISSSTSFSFTSKTVGQPWPMPQVYVPTSDVFMVSPNFQFQVTGTDCAILRSALNRYGKIIFGRYDYESGKADFQPRTPYVVKFSSSRTMTELSVNLMGECEEWPSFGMDERYELILGYTGCYLNSKSIWGILRGLETFTQLIYEGSDGMKQVNVSSVQDYPRFSHRGVLLDTSRHYLPKRSILKNLEAMAYNKLNVFHWHIVDDQSFPYQSVAFPDITRKGAYDPVTHIYTQEDVAEIIEFARIRGIRVIPEFDTPGHSESWGPGQPGLLTPCYDSDGRPSGSYGPIDPTKNTTYSFLTEFMKELTTVFKDHYLHLGGDEVSFSCWQSNPMIKEFMTNMSFGTDYSKLESFYVQKLLDIVASYKAGYIVWQEVFDNKVKIDLETIVEVWKNSPSYSKELQLVTEAGYHAILSSCWYLNRIANGDWANFYKCDPHSFNGSVQQKALVIGGELCMWGEFVDASNVISRIWPRGSAVAERLWSSEQLKSTSRAQPRLEEHRCRMLRRGLQVEPLFGPGFCAHEFNPQ